MISKNPCFQSKCFLQCPVDFLFSRKYWILCFLKTSCSLPCILASYTGRTYHLLSSGPMVKGYYQASSWIWKKETSLHILPQVCSGLHCNNYLLLLAWLQPVCLWHGVNSGGACPESRVGVLPEWAVKNKELSGLASVLASHTAICMVIKLYRLITKVIKFPTISILMKLCILICMVIKCVASFT